jgi:Domain of unknown function (DUF4331)
MSSHREAPQISKDPTADSTDVYAFVSPDDPSKVTLIANYLPLEHPDGGPNFYEFDDGVMYDINVDNNGDGLAEVQFQFYFQTTNTIPTSFLYNDGPITSLTGKGASLWNRKQTFTCVRHEYNPTTHKLENSTTLADKLPCPPCNIGPLSTPNYASLAESAVHTDGRTKVFAGQRAEGFYVDLGAVFDLGDLRPFEQDHFQYALPAGMLKQMPGVNSTAAVNVHTLAIETNISLLTSTGKAPTDVTDPSAVIGVWTSASRQKVRMYEHNGEDTNTGPWVQVSRLGNPLVNEVLTPLGQKDFWNTVRPVHDSQFAPNFTKPLLGELLPLLYSSDGAGKNSVFPNLMAFNNGTSAADKLGRLDLAAILLLGIPDGVVPGVTFSTYPKKFTSFTKYVSDSVFADQLRLNVAIKPVAPGDKGYSNLGVIGGDIGGFPNGRRVADDVATIELRAVAGATLPLINPFTKNNFTADAAAGAVSFGLTSSATDATAMGTENYLTTFPYLGVPYSGYDTPTTTPTSKGTAA